MRLYQASCVNSFDYGDMDKQYAWDLVTATVPLFMTLESAQQFCAEDATEWAKTQNEYRDDEDFQKIDATIQWEENRLGQWIGTLVDVEPQDWSATITRCATLDDEH